MKTKGDRTFTYHALHDKEKRSLTILELIRKKGVISRTDISRATGINAVSVSNYISSFIKNTLVLEKGHAVSSGGRKPELVELNAKENFAIGVDICAEEITLTLVDIGLNVIAKKKAARPADAKELAGIVAKLIEDAMGSAKIATACVKAIGICVSCESLLPVRDAIEKRLGIDTFICDAASCEAFSEKRFNKDADVEKLLYVHSDVGRGIIIDDETCTGCPADSGEIEEPAAAAEEGADLAYSEKVKYLSPWSDYLGIIEMAKREVSRGIGTKIVSLSGGEIDKVTEKVVIDAARQNDETALNIIQSIAINLGLRISYLINLFGPQAVVIGGGTEAAPELTFPFINKMVKRLSLKKYNDTVRVMPSTLGKNGLSLGASALAVREIFLKA